MRIVLTALSFLLVVAAWELARLVIPSPDIFLPSPIAVLTSLGEMFRTNNFAADIIASIWRVTAGFILAIVVGYPLGLAIGTSKAWRAFVEPLNDFARYLPVAAMVPLVIVWFGINDTQKIIVIFLGSVFQFIPMVADSVARVPKELIELGRTLGYGNLEITGRVVAPATAPAVYDHARVVLGWAWSYVIVAEIVAANSGVGHVIIQAQRFIKTDEVIAGMLTIGVLGLLFDQVFRLPRTRLFPWLRK